MSAENKAEKPKNSLGDALSSEALENMREQAKGNLKEQIKEKIQEDIDNLILAEKDPSFGSSQEIFQIKEELNLLLGKVGALENPTEDEVKSLETEREALSNRLSETSKKIEFPEPTNVSPSAETEPPAQTQEPAKGKKYPIVREKRDQGIIEKVKTESKEKQQEQISLAIERLADQKSKLENILAKPDLPASKKGLIGRAIEETKELSQKASESKEKGIGINENTVERLWARVEKNFDIISEELLVPANLPIDLSNEEEGNQMTRDLEQRLKEEKKPPEKMDIALGEKEPNRFEASEEAKTLITEMEQIKDKLDRILLEDFDIPSDLGEQLNTEQRRLSGLVEFLNKDNSQPILDKSKQEIKITQNIIRKYEAQNAPKEMGLEDLEKSDPPPLFEITPEEEKRHEERLKLQQLVDEARDNTPFDKINHPLTAEEEAHNENENRNANESFDIGEIPKELLNTPEAEPTAQEVEAISKVETIEDVEKLPEKTKEKMAKGFETWGLRVDAFKDKQWSNLFSGISKLFKEGEDKNRLFVNIQNSFLRSREKSKEKLENVGTGKMAKATSAASLTGNVLRYGRGIMDATGLSVVNPLRWVTWGSMALSRFGEGIKEVAIEQSSAESRLDEEEALAQAIKIYEKAGGTYDLEKGGDEKASRTALKTAYYQDVPKDLIKRLESRTPDEKRTTLQKFGESLMTFRMEKSIAKTQEKLDEIEKSSLTEEEKEQKRTEIVKKYETLLRDYDRIIDENGQIDMLAMLGKRMESISKYVVTAMTLETLAELPFAVEKMWDHASQILGGHSEANTSLAFQAFESNIGVDSKNGLDKTEVLKIGKAIKYLEVAGHSDQAESIREHYAPQMAELLGQTTNTTAEVPTGLTKTEVEENMKMINGLKTSNPQRAKELLEYYANAKVEGSGLSFKNIFEHPEKLQDIKIGSTPATDALKPFRFENPIAGNEDSIWFSTEQSFRMNPDHFGYNIAKDGTISEWAKHKTAEALKELADKKFGGKLPDIVHDGDKVIVEIGTDGKAQVSFENSSGVPAGNLPEKLDITKPETHSITDSDKFEKAWKNVPSGDVQDSQHASIVRQYVLTEIAKPEYQAGDFPKLNSEKINVYTKMFGGEWNKINNPEKLAQSLFEFDNRIKEYTAMVLGGKFDKVTDPTTLQQLKANIFPIEGKSGKLFFTQFVDEGKWQLFQEDAQGITKQLDHKKGLFGGKTQVFDTMHVRKFLRSH